MGKIHVLLWLSVILLSTEVGADRQYSILYIDLSPLPYRKPSMEELNMEANISLPSAMVEQIMIMNQREYIQLEKTRFRVGLEAFEGL